MKHEGIGGVTRFVIMNNIFNSPLEPVEKFDLKAWTRFLPGELTPAGLYCWEINAREEAKGGRDTQGFRHQGYGSQTLPAEIVESEVHQTIAERHRSKSFGAHFSLSSS